MMRQLEILNAIVEERKRQDKLHPNNNNDNDYLSIIIEEIGEVARAMQGEGNIQEELIHVAASAVRWLESI